MRFRSVDMDDAGIVVLPVITIGERLQVACGARSVPDGANWWQYVFVHD